MRRSSGGRPATRTVIVCGPGVTGSQRSFIWLASSQNCPSRSTPAPSGTERSWTMPYEASVGGGDWAPDSADGYPGGGSLGYPGGGPLWGGGASSVGYSVPEDGGG